MGMTPQYFHTIPTSHANCALCLLVNVCIGGLWKAMGCVVLHVDLHGECMSYAVGGCNV